MFYLSIWLFFNNFYCPGVFHHLFLSLCDKSTATIFQNSLDDEKKVDTKFALPSFDNSLTKLGSQIFSLMIEINDWHNFSSEKKCSTFLTNKKQQKQNKTKKQQPKKKKKWKRLLSKLAELRRFVVNI